MSDHAFVSILTNASGNAPTVEYVECVGKIIVRVGAAELYLPPVDAAELIDKLTAALDVYASTLKAVA